jgi:hypothetical protein
MHETTLQKTFTAARRKQMREIRWAGAGWDRSRRKIAG